MTSHLIFVNVEHSKGAMIMHMSKSNTAEDFFKQVRIKCGLNNPVFFLVLEGTMVLENDRRSLDEIGFRNGCTVHLVYFLSGGIHDVTPLPGYVTLTSIEPCCIMGDDDPTVKRVKMKCGCVFDVEAMKEYCRTKIDEGWFYFPCGKCNYVWPTLAVSHVLSASLAESEFQFFSKKVNENYFKCSLSIRKCPTCKNFVTRSGSQKFLNPNWVVCPICNGNGFCWICKKPWIGNIKSCGNTGCDNTDPRLHHLRNCPTTTVGTVFEVPLIRLCAKCGILIQFRDGCKHMHCTNCNYDFCFVCLKPKKYGTRKVEWQCGAHDASCVVAPRQTEVFDFQPLTLPQFL